MLRLLFLSLLATGTVACGDNTGRVSALAHLPKPEPDQVDRRRCMTSRDGLAVCTDGRALVFCNQDDDCMVVDLHTPAEAP